MGAICAFFRRSHQFTPTTRSPHHDISWSLRMAPTLLERSRMRQSIALVFLLSLAACELPTFEEAAAPAPDPAALPAGDTVTTDAGAAPDPDVQDASPGPDLAPRACIAAL